VRVMEDESPLLDGTKCILLLGEAAMWKYGLNVSLNTLNELRGSVLTTKWDIPAIATYLPQEATDQINHEATHNPLCKSRQAELEAKEDEDEGNVKAHGNTKRINYSFWMRRDVWKCKQILQGKFQQRHSDSPVYHIYPSADEVIKLLTNTKNEILDFDMETDIEALNLQCFAFSFGNSHDVYCVPILDHTYKTAYSVCHKILRALAIACRDNTVVAHNGSCFDFRVLALRYRIPVYKCYDTLIAMHRCFPDVEKSLGHCVSYWTWEPFHKDQDSHGYRTHEQMMDRMRYCAKDVWTMKLVRQAITDYAKTIPGLTKSIDDAMRCIRPYLTSTIIGVRVDEQKVNDIVNENDRLMVQYNRMAEILIGKDSLTLMKNGSKSMFAGSNKQCARYFHELMGYPVQGKTDAGAPALGKHSLYKLALKYTNPVIQLVCIYRSTQKETSRLRFTPWEGKLV